MEREGYLHKIVQSLSVHELNIKRKNQIGLTNDNRHSQILFGNFLNILFGWDLELTDKNNPNYPAIDLGDKNLRISVQVSSDTSLTKIRDTIELFEKHALESEYDRLKFLFIGAKVKRTGSANASKFNFDLEEDCIYTEDLIKNCNLIRDISLLQKLAHLLESELGNISNTKINEIGIDSLKRISNSLIESFMPPNIYANFTRNITHEETVQKALGSARKLTFQKRKESEKQNSIEIEELLNQPNQTFFIEGFGGMGKTHLIWNFAKNLLEKETIPIYLSLSNFLDVESIEKYLKSFDQKLSLFEISNKSNIIFLLDGWTEFAQNLNNRSEHSKLLSLISNSKVIVTGRFITEFDTYFTILKLERFRKSEIEKYLNKTPSDEISVFLEYPLFFILYIYLNETISKPHELLKQFYLKITEKFEDNSKFLNILSFVAAKIEIDKLDKTWVNFERLISDETNKKEINEWQNLITSSGIIKNIRDRLEPTHDIYWEWLVGIGIHLNWKDFGHFSLSSVRLRDCLHLSRESFENAKLDHYHYDLLDNDLNAFAIFYQKANTEKKKEFDSKLSKALESKNNSVAFDSIYAFFLSESVESISKAKEATYRLLKEGFYFPKLKEKISNTFLWNHKEEFMGWISDDNPAYFIIEAIQETKDERWANWIESIYIQGLISYPTALKIFLSTSGDFPDWIRENLSDFILKNHAYHLKPATQLGKNHQLAAWLYENYSLILGEGNNSDFLHINDVIFSCANSELLNRIELSFNTLESKVKELLMYGIRATQPEMAVNIARSYQFNSEREIHYFDSFDLSTIEEEIIRGWMVHSELRVQDFGWKNLAKKHQHQLLAEIESSLPSSFENIHLCPPLRALAEIRNLPRKWENILISRVNGTLQPMLTSDLISAYSNITEIGIISFYKSFIAPNPIFLSLIHLHHFLTRLIHWEKENAMELRMNFSDHSSNIKLSDWLIAQNLMKFDSNDSFITPLIGLISSPDVKKQIALLFKDNLLLSKFFEIPEQKQKTEAKEFKNLLNESNYDQAFKIIAQCIKEIERDDLILILNYYNNRENFQNVESILYQISQRNIEDADKDLIFLLKYFSDKKISFKEIRILAQITAKLNINSIYEIFYPYVFIKNNSILMILVFTKYFSDIVTLNDKFDFYFYQKPFILSFLAKIPILNKLTFLLMNSNIKHNNVIKPR
jgi:hypothetical protein